MKTKWEVTLQRKNTEIIEADGFRITNGSLILVDGESKGKEEVVAGYMDGCWKNIRSLDNHEQR